MSLERNVLSHLFSAFLFSCSSMMDSWKKKAKKRPKGFHASREDVDCSRQITNMHFQTGTLDLSKWILGRTCSGGFVLKEWENKQERAKTKINWRTALRIWKKGFVVVPCLKKSVFGAQVFCTFYECHQRIPPRELCGGIFRLLIG